MAIEFDPINTEKVIKDSIKEVEPNAELLDGTALADFYVKPLRLLLEAFQKEQDRLDAQRTLLNYQTLDEDQMNSLAANFYVPRKVEGLATGTVRLFFETPRNLTVSVGTIFVDKEGRTFEPVQNTSISLAQMTSNISNGRYFLDVTVQATAAGSDFNILAGDIISIRDNTQLNATEVTNINDFIGGAAAETNAELYERIGLSLGERSLVRESAIMAMILNVYTPMRLFVAGYLDKNSYGDVIVKRDIIKHLVNAVETTEHYGGKIDVFVKPQVLSDNLVTFDLSDRTTFPLSAAGLRQVSIEAPNDAYAFPLPSSLMPLLPLIDINSVCLAQGSFANDQGCSNYILRTEDFFIISPSTGPVYPTVTTPRPASPLDIVAAYADPANLRYSIYESLQMVIKKSVINNSLTLDLINDDWLVRIDYKTSPLISEIQSFLDNPSNRTLTDNPVVKHFFPVFIDFDVNVSGDGVTSDAVKAVLEDAIYRDEIQEVSDIVGLLYSSGVSRVQLPISVTVRAPRIDAYIDSNYANNPDAYVITVVTQDKINENEVLTSDNHIDLFRTHTLLPGNINVTVV